MKRILFLGLFILIFLTGCDTTTSSQQGPALTFLPRICSLIGCRPMRRVEQSYDGTKYYEYQKTEENESVNAENLVLLFYTGNNGGLYDYDEPIPSLEKEIELDYKQAYTSYGKSGGEGMAFIDINYRTTGIRKLNIYAKDAVLFGKTPGVSLNDYFDIVLYEPNFIASYDTRSLIYGFRSSKPAKISEWLSLSPMAQPGMYLHLNTVPEEAPLNTCFIVQAETSTGLILSDTTITVALIR
jgi:hypothetical protein